LSDYTTYTDGQLLTSLQNGDEKAFRQLYDRYWKMLLLSACNRINNYQDAQELVQDIFINIWKRRQELNIKNTISTYLHAAVKYKVINYYSAQSSLPRQQPVEEGHIAHSEFLTGNTPTSCIDFRELENQLSNIINSLPEKCKLVFKLSRENDFSYRQIATELNIAEKTVQAHISLALNRIRAGLGTLWTILSIIKFFL
jgi:RNA polymerase sigma-70 factor (family 1)